eukprot:SAG22_NODE_3790_length_1530_cov_1.915444_1_plen_72_part_10
MLIRPGDVCLFSGAQAHCAVCVGGGPEPEPEPPQGPPQGGVAALAPAAPAPAGGLSLTAYESFVNLNPLHCR